MKSSTKCSMFLMSILLICSCQKPDRDNPWDELNKLNPEDWSPHNLQVETISPVERKLIWSFENHIIEGFKIDRKQGDEPWQEAYATLEKEARSWNDNNIIPDPSLTYVYRVYAYAGSNISKKETIAESAAIPGPSDLQITQNTITSVTLNWQGNSTGEEGFRIERKQGIENWEQISTLPGTTYTDATFELNTVVLYQVYAYYGQYLSELIEYTFDSQIPLPENLSFTQNSSTSVSLHWIYNLPGIDKFTLERKRDQNLWQLIAQIDSEYTSFTDDEIYWHEFDYSYRLSAHSGNFNSGFAEINVYYTFSIGEVYSGGIIFLLDDYGGGLVSTENDQNTSSRWGCHGIMIGGTSTIVGAGAANTTSIVSSCSEDGIAALICNDLFLNGYNDWILPSKDELNLMYLSLKISGIGNFADNYYWSSSESNSNDAWGQHFGTGAQFSRGKGNNLDRVRCIRVF
jgi:hypothetical protein